MKRRGEWEGEGGRGYRRRGERKRRKVDSGRKIKKRNTKIAPNKVKTKDFRALQSLVKTYVQKTFEYAVHTASLRERSTNLQKERGKRSVVEMFGIQKMFKDITMLGHAEAVAPYATGTIGWM